MNILRRLSLSRLLLLCGLVAAIGVSATALALAVSGGPTPPPKPLAQAVHDALAAPPVAGVTARIQLTDHLLEGANLADGAGGEAGQLASSPLISGASGRLWISAGGDVRLELQSEKGDTQILYDGHTISLYDASSNTLYRYTPPQQVGAGDSGMGTAAHHGVPTVQEVQEGISHLMQHATLSGATPTDVAGQPAYTTRISPIQNGGLIGGAELSWDANTGVPLRAAVYSTTSSAPVIELTATESSYGAVESSVFDVTPPANAKVEEITLPTKHGSQSSGSTNDSSSGSANDDAGKPTVTRHGQGLEAITVLESPMRAGQKEASGSQMEGLPQVNINGATATELPTALGTLLSFERSGIRYLLVGSVTPATIEAAAKGL
jgi:outer membrane lipoprotein-sorting protein